MGVKIKSKKPINKLIFWFKYNIIFWRLKKVTQTRLSGNDIDQEKYDTYFIQHIFSRKLLSYNGWGNKLLQEAIYQINGEYEEFEKCSIKKFGR